MIINKKLISNKILPEEYTYNSRDHTLTVYIGDVCGLDKYKVYTYLKTIIDEVSTGGTIAPPNKTS